MDISWTTATEINNNYFTVEKTIDAVNYSTVATIDGAGNSTQKINYFTTDEAPYSGISYYRLKQTDFDGRYTYSDLAPVNFSPAHNLGLNIYPNPSDGENLFIEVTSAAPEEDVLVVVYNALGEEIYSKIVVTGISGNVVFAFDKSGKLSPGVYLVTASGINGDQIFNKRLVVR